MSAFMLKRFLIKSMQKHSILLHFFKRESENWVYFSVWNCSYIIAKLESYFTDHLWPESFTGDSQLAFPANFFRRKDSIKNIWKLHNEANNSQGNCLAMIMMQPQPLHCAATWRIPRSALRVVCESFLFFFYFFRMNQLLQRAHTNSSKTQTCLYSNGSVSRFVTRNFLLAVFPGMIEWWLETWSVESWKKKWLFHSNASS